MVSAVRSMGLEWDGAGMPEAPSAPETIKQAGLTLGFLNDLILKTLYTSGGMLGLDMARYLCLPFKVIEESLRFLKDEKCLEVAAGRLPRRGRPPPSILELSPPPPHTAPRTCCFAWPAPH